MRVGIVTEWFDRGSAFVSQEIIRNLENQGIETYIYVRSEAAELNQEIWPGKRVYEGKIGKSRVTKSIDRKDFESWIDKNLITHLIFNEQIWFPPVEWANLKGVITVGYVDYYTKKSVPKFYLYDALICNTSRHYSVFSWHPNAWHIPWGTNLEIFKPYPLKKNWELTFLHSAGWSPHRKGTDLAIRAFIQLNQSDVRLIIHSQHSLKDWLRSQGLLSFVEKDCRITVIEKKLETADFLHLGDVYLYPSRLEGIGLTQVEAQASGLPLIVTNEEPMSEFARDGISRTVVVARHWTRADNYYWPMSEVDVNSLTEQLNWFYANKESREEWKIIIRSYAEENFDSSKNFSNLGSLLKATQKLPLSRARSIHNSFKFGGWRLQSELLIPAYYRFKLKYVELRNGRGN